MAYLIDAFNVMHAVPELESLLREDRVRAACQRLTQLVVRWVHLYPQRKAVLVFDGARQGPVVRLANLQVLYVGKQADEELRRQLRRRGGGDVLVSGDREITSVAHGVGSHVLTPGGFWEELVEPDEEDPEAVKERPLSQAEVEEWKRLFE